jgi:hypothetical protein
MVVGTAKTFSEEQFKKSKKVQKLRKTLEKGDSEERLFSKGVLEVMKGEAWFKSISDDVTKVLKGINTSLQIRKFLIFKSSPGCKQQRFHLHHNSKTPSKRYTVMFSIMDNTSFDVKLSSQSDVEISIKLSPVSWLFLKMTVFMLEQLPRT